MTVRERDLLEIANRFPLEGFEKSFKIVGDQILDQRFLFGISRQFIDEPKALQVFDDLVMPETLKNQLSPLISKADLIHFGWEGENNVGLCKVYLEFSTVLSSAAAKNAEPEQSLLLHRACKWDVNDANRQLITNYQVFPNIGIDLIESRMNASYCSDENSSIATLMSTLLRLVCERSSKPPLYLEMSEDGNKRSSWCIQIWNAKLHLNDVGRYLQFFARHNGASVERLLAIGRASNNGQISNISGGIDRKERPYLTVYYV
jgi:hypothetical protein